MTRAASSTLWVEPECSGSRSATGQPGPVIVPQSCRSRVAAAGSPTVSLSSVASTVLCRQDEQHGTDKQCQDSTNAPRQNVESGECQNRVSSSRLCDGRNRNRVGLRGCPG